MTKRHIAPSDILNPIGSDLNTVLMLRPGFAAVATGFSPRNTLLLVTFSHASTSREHRTRTQRLHHKHELSSAERTQRQACTQAVKHAGRQVAA